MSFKDSKLHFVPRDFTPNGSPGEQLSSILGHDVLEKLDQVVEELWRNGICRVQMRADRATQTVIATLASLEVLGAIELTTDTRAVIVRTPTRYTKGFVRTYAYCLRARIPIVSNWQVTHPLFDSVCGSALLRSAELQRIAISSNRGVPPEPFNHHRAAFVVIKGRSVLGKPVYLFDYNRNWDMYNLIGGKEEQADGGDLENTARREIEEELGVAPARVRLMDITPNGPIGTLSLLGNYGVLTHYTVKIFLAKVSGDLKLRGRQKWFSTTEVEKRVGARGEQFLLHPAYFDHLRDLPGGIHDLPYSYKGRIYPARLLHASEFLRENKREIGAILTGIGLLATIVKAIFVFLH